MLSDASMPHSAEAAVEAPWKGPPVGAATTYVALYGSRSRPTDRRSVRLSWARLERPRQVSRPRGLGTSHLDPRRNFVTWRHCVSPDSGSLRRFRGPAHPSTKYPPT